MLVIFETFSHFLLVLALGYYVITAMQWFSYRIKRVVFHFTKPKWHLFFFLIPLFAYYLTGVYFWIYFYFAYIPSLYLWYKKLDKPLVFTKRIQRFFIFLILATFFQDFLCLALKRCDVLGVILPLFVSIGISMLFEKILFEGFKKQAKKKLSEMNELKIIAITASYGKTSIKNFLYHILEETFTCYKTPRSVNTLGGLMQDVNNVLPTNTQIYIAEAGAREQGDILEIAQFLEPQIAVVGEIGLQHVEYFKTLENIRNTKMELIQSPRLEQAFVHEGAQVNPNNKVILYGSELSNIQATLDGTSFTMDIDGVSYPFETKLLGTFNAMNIAVCIHVARYLGMPMVAIQKRVNNLKSVEHRLSRMDAGGKIIIDDSFNGNFEGMRASYELVSEYSGRKVLITPGIVESTEEENRALAHVMNEIFDVVMITGSLNAALLVRELKKPEIHILKDKAAMETLLAQETRAGDLILFSNDAPGFI